MGCFQSGLDVAGQEFLEFEAGLSGASFDFAKERVGDFERGAHESILAQKRTGLNPECLGAVKEDEQDGLARTRGTTQQNSRSTLRGQLSAFFRETVLLQAAIGFLGKGAFDQGSIQKLSDPKIQFCRDAGMSEGTRQIRLGKGGGTQAIQDSGSERL